jgi:hypothetical protein
MGDFFFSDTIISNSLCMRFLFKACILLLFSQEILTNLNCSYRGTVCSLRRAKSNLR